MEAKKSSLILNDFLLLNQKYQYKQPSEENIDIREITDQYDLNIDFAVHKMDDSLYQLFTKIGVNNIEDPLPGYILFIEGACIFSFSQDAELSDKGKSNLLHYSGLQICINSLRNILATITANGPFGKYTLPPVDVNHLLAAKHQQTSSKE